MFTKWVFFIPIFQKCGGFFLLSGQSPGLFLTLECGIVNRTIKAAGCEEGSCFICQVTVEGAAQSQDVNGFLFRTVKEVVLNGSGDRASAIF